MRYPRASEFRVGEVIGPKKEKLYPESSHPLSICCERSSFILRCQVRLRTDCIQGKREGYNRTRKSRILERKGSPPHGEQEKMQVSEVDGRAIWQPLGHHMET